MNNAEIARLDAEIEDAATRSEAIDTLRWELEKQREKLIAEDVLESMLRKFAFQVNEYNGKLFIEVNNGFDTLARAEKDLLCHGASGAPYHFTRELSESVEISVSDGDLSIRFSNNENIIPFIKKHKLRVFTDNVEDKLKTMNEDLAKKRLAIEELEKLRDMFAQKE